MPEVNNRFYIVGKPTQSKSISEPKRITYKVVNPTKTIIHITGTTSRFILGTKESFSPKWQLNGAPNEHLRMNGAMNAWLVDLPKKCEANCKLNSDGSYSFDLVMEFKPQRAFYLGAFISAFTLLGIIAYVAGRSIFKRKRPIYKVGKRVSKRMV